MRLAKLSAQNYRTLENILINFSDSYCTVSGQNNAGKSCVIRLLTGLLPANNLSPFFREDSVIDYKDDKTQWVKADAPIRVSYTFELTNSNDPALVSFIEKIAQHPKESDAAKTSLQLDYTAESNGDTTVSVSINGKPVDDKASREIEKRLQNSNLMFLYNSTVQHDDIYFERGKRRSLFDFTLSKQEREMMDAANKNIEKQVQKLAKEHVFGLTEMLGKLKDQYDVELSPPQGFNARRMALGINLRDKSVQVPINDWGSGTQNRTHILMAILRANRIKQSAVESDKITPMVVVEEPESFLHPSPQAEFGRILRHLSAELGIQIIVTTHSPYMLNQEKPSANILLKRAVRYNKLGQTEVVATSEQDWMAPFAEQLGIAKEEFSSLKSMFTSDTAKALLVEGDIDKSYFEFLKTHPFDCPRLTNDIEVSTYGGKDTLKNTVLVKLVLGKFDKVFVTYDLDAKAECSGALNRAGLSEKYHMALGLNLPGKDCIEGLLPNTVLSAVNGRETDLVMASGSASNKRRNAKDDLKKRYLEEFKDQTELTAEGLKHLKGVIDKINDQLG